MDYFPDWRDNLQQDVEIYLDFLDDRLDFDAADQFLVLEILSKHYTSKADEIHSSKESDMLLEIYHAVQQSIHSGDDTCWFDAYKTLHNLSTSTSEYTPEMETSQEHLRHWEYNSNSGEMETALREVSDILSKYPIESETDAEIYNMVLNTLSSFYAGYAEEQYCDIEGRMNLAVKCSDISQKYKSYDDMGESSIKQCFLSAAKWAELKHRMEIGQMDDK